MVGIVESRYYAHHALSFIDVVKVRLMNDKERRYQGVSDCVKQIVQKEGPKAFYKGFGMCWARVSAPSAALRLSQTRVTDMLTIDTARNSYDPEFRCL